MATPQEALASLQPFCDPRRPADLRAAARAHCLLAARGPEYRLAACASPLCLHMGVAQLAAAGQLEPCLQWMGTVHVHRLHLSSPGAPLRLAQLEALAQRLPPGAGAGVRRLVLETDRLGQTFDAAVLAPFARLALLELRFFTGADLAALPPSVRSVAIRLPGTQWALAQSQRAHRRLPPGQRPADWQVAGWVAAAGGQHQLQELTAGMAPGPESLLGEMPQPAHVLLAATQALHPAPQPAAIEWAAAFLQLTELGAQIDPFFISPRPPEWLLKLRAAVTAALAATLALDWALRVVRDELAARRAAAAAVDGRLSFILAPPGALAMGFAHQQAAAGLGQLLRDSLAAVVALGTLRPLVRHLAILAPGMPVALDAAVLAGCAAALTVCADRLELTLAGDGMRSGPRQGRQQHAAALLAQLAAGGLQRAELAAAAFAFPELGAGTLSAAQLAQLLPAGGVGSLAARLSRPRHGQQQAARALQLRRQRRGLPRRALTAAAVGAAAVLACRAAGGRSEANEGARAGSCKQEADEDLLAPWQHGPWWMC
ncbi:hypothetical protein ABPG75_006167 [Micractinium tetrahymenae]